MVKIYKYFLKLDSLKACSAFYKYFSPHIAIS